MSLFILAFDHRDSLMTSFLGVTGEPSAEDVAAAAEIKRTIADGLLAAIDRGYVRGEDAGGLVDATYGSDALGALQAAGVRVAVPVEASGRAEFAFEHVDWRERINILHPTWAKALVRYNPEGDRAMNERQRDRLLDLQSAVRGTGVRFLFELLVPPEPNQRTVDFDRGIRPGLMVGAIAELRAGGIAPDLWKVEGLDRREDCEAVAAAAGAPCLVLGRGADVAAVERWLRASAGLLGYDGFAIGRSIWWDPIRAHLNGIAARDDAVIEIADRYGHFVGVHQEASRSSAVHVAE